MNNSGPALALLLLEGFRTMVDMGTAELAKRGHPDVRAVHDFALRAIDAGADSAVALGRRLSVSKQAAAKTIVALEERGYVMREPDGGDGRRKRIIITPLGRQVLTTGEEIFDSIRQQWAERIGSAALQELEQSLRMLVGGNKDPLETAGWLARTTS
jgi:DNA-binding MarR family transcriptional regulator